MCHQQQPWPPRLSSSVLPLSWLLQAGLFCLFLAFVQDFALIFFQNFQMFGSLTGAIFVLCILLDCPVFRKSRCFQNKGRSLWRLSGASGECKVDVLRSPALCSSRCILKCWIYCSVGLRASGIQQREMQVSQRYLSDTCALQFHWTSSLSPFSGVMYQFHTNKTVWNSLFYLKITQYWWNFVLFNI